MSVLRSIVSVLPEMETPKMRSKRAQGQSSKPTQGQSQMPQGPTPMSQGPMSQGPMSQGPTPKAQMMPRPQAPQMAAAQPASAPQQISAAKAQQLKQLHQQLMSFVLFENPQRLLQLQRKLQQQYSQDLKTIVGEEAWMLLCRMNSIMHIR